MTREEAAIVTAYTGVLIGEFDDFSKYAEKIIGRSIMTHELASKEMWKELRSAAYNDFVSINIGAEKHPQPDAETGLMPCGCGGWPDVISPNNSIALYLVQCDRCHIETDCYDTKQEAIDAWNKALG